MAQGTVGINMYKNWIDKTFTLHNADGTKTTTQGSVDWEEIKRWRELVLKDCDWWAMSDRTISDDQRAYRQFLRDLPQTYTDAADAYAAILAYTEP